MILIPRKQKSGCVTAYNAIIGSAEARRAGFVLEDGTRVELEKIVDEENQRIIIQPKKVEDK